MRISIHAPHAGSDLTTTERIVSVQGFQSTLPMRGATTRTAIHCPAYRISIHAPHAGSDMDWQRKCSGDSDFNPRSPCGERPDGYAIGSNGYNFNPRSPCGERHSDNACVVFTLVFQSTLPMRGATSYR